MAQTLQQTWFSGWLEQQRPGLLRMAQSIIKDRFEAEDVVQDTALALWRRLEQGGIDDPAAYARRAVWVNALKRRSRWRDWVPLEAEALALRGLPEPASPLLPELELSAWELEAAIAELPAAQQAVLRLRFYGGLSFAETAQALSLSINTAASRCRYALHSLRQMIRKYEEPNPKEENHAEPRRKKR
jgi:RNA polymerase sigma-70 factor (ECF subfamily)